MLLELGASTSLRKEAILPAVGSPKWQFCTKKWSQCKKMLVTHLRAASLAAPGADGHGRTVSLGDGGCVCVCVCVCGGGVGGAWSSSRRRRLLDGRPSACRDPVCRGPGAYVNPENTDGLDW